MKMRSVLHNNRKKTFEVKTATGVFVYPYAKADPQPTGEDPIVRVFVDPELSREGFTYVLESGKEGAVHIEQVFAYNQDPRYWRDQFLYQLTIEAQKRVAVSPLSKREIIRRLETSAAQFYRLLDQTNYSKSVDQMLSLLHVLDCPIGRGLASFIAKESVYCLANLGGSEKHLMSVQRRRSGRAA